MRFDLKDLIMKKNCIEIKRKGIIYWRIFLFRVNIKVPHIIHSMPGLLRELGQKMKILTSNVIFSIEIYNNSEIFFYFTREQESINNARLAEFKKIIENWHECKLEELLKDDLEERFWGIFYRNTNFSNIIFEENSFKFLIKGRVAHLAIFSIKNSKILTNLLDLIASLKIKQFKLYFNNNLDSISKICINLSIQSETIEKIQELYSIISTNFSRDSISLYVPNKSLFTQYLLKFLCSTQIVKRKLVKTPQFPSPQKFLRNNDFEEERPLVFIHRKKLIAVIILRKINLRFVKYYLKTYYKKYFLVFWVLNPKLFNILENNTKLRYLQNCRVHNKKKEVLFWEKAIQLNSENS